MSRVIVGVLALVVLGGGCDLGTDDGAKGFEDPSLEEIPAPDGRERPPGEDVVPTPEALESCRELSTEENAVERCLQVVRGYPDPFASSP